MAKDSLQLRIISHNAVAMGPGKADLLDAIDQYGSISAAAKSMNMSYRRAWELVDMMNKCFNQPLVTSASGGQHGGGAQLTEFGRFILKSYRELVAKTYTSANLDLANILSNLKASE